MVPGEAPCRLRAAAPLSFKLLGTPVPAMLATGTLFNYRVCPHTLEQLCLPECTHLSPIKRSDNEPCQR